MRKAGLMKSFIYGGIGCVYIHVYMILYEIFTWGREGEGSSAEMLGKPQMTSQFLKQELTNMSSFLKITQPTSALLHWYNINIHSEHLTIWCLAVLIMNVGLTLLFREQNWATFIQIFFFEMGFICTPIKSLAFKNCH